MSSAVRFCIVASALLALMGPTMAARNKAYNLCNLRCVRRIYRDYCGGASCVFGVQTEKQLHSLCSTTCLDALAGEKMFSCVQKRDPARVDTANVIANKVVVVSNFCLSAFPPPLEAEGPATDGAEKHDVDDLEGLD